jgi:hypothetical protein
MAIELTYPIYAIWRDGGFHCLEGEDEAGNPTMGVMIFTDGWLADQWIEDNGLDATVKTIPNHYQFRRFLVSLKEPKPKVVCDAAKDSDGVIDAQWSEEVNTLLEDVLPPVAFQWDYPLFLIKEGVGFASINGTKPTGERLTLVATFTDVDLAESYMQRAEVAGTIVNIPSEAKFAEFVNSLLPPAQGVVFDPTDATPGSKSKVCLDKHTLLAIISPGKIGTE